MSALPTKVRPVRLDAERYRNLRRQVLERDGWRCQLCDSMDGVEVHHKQRRSQAGEDSEDNLITLCSACHHTIHP